MANDDLSCIMCSLGPRPLTIGITNYNHARFLPEALESLLFQSWRDFQVIVIDDKSTDDSVQVLRRYAEKYPEIRLIENGTNQGVIANVLTLLSLAQSKYYYAAAADDFVLPGFLEKTIAQLERHPEAGLCSSLSYAIDADGRNPRLLFSDPFGNRQPSYYFSPVEVRRRFETALPWIQGNTVIYRREALLEAGGFRPELGSFCDGFVQGVVALKHGACFVPEPLAAWRVMPHNFSMSTGLQPDVSCRVRDFAEGYMTREYRGLFSNRYLRRWRRRWNAAALNVYLTARRRELLKRLRAMLRPEQPLERVVLALASAIVVIGGMLLVAVAAILRWFDLWALLGNRIKRRRHRSVLPPLRKEAIGIK